MVLDSAFANLFDLMMELVDVYKIRLPKFTVWFSVFPLPLVFQEINFDFAFLLCLVYIMGTFFPSLAIRLRWLYST